MTAPSRQNPTSGFGSVIALLISAILLCSCGGETPIADSSAALTPLPGDKVITSVGSSALLPLIAEAAKQFQAIHPDLEVLVDKGGSAVGITRVAADDVDLGNSDVEATEIANIDTSMLIDHRICAQGFAVAVNQGVTVDNLSTAQVIGIFTGKIRNWREISGQDLPIAVVSRPQVSGTRRIFTRVVLNGGDPNGKVAEVGTINLYQDSSSDVENAIAKNPGAIGYLGLAYFTSAQVKKLKYNGVEGNEANIIAGTYPIWSYGHMYTLGQPSATVQDFINYILSPDFQRNSIEKFGYIPMNKIANSSQP